MQYSNTNKTSKKPKIPTPISHKSYINGTNKNSFLKTLENKFSKPAVSKSSARKHNFICAGKLIFTE